MLVSYPVDVERIREGVLPPGVEVDRWKGWGEGEGAGGGGGAMVTLRCLSGSGARVLGFAVPAFGGWRGKAGEGGGGSYKQVELLLHAKSAGQSGVVVLRRLVDQKWLAWAGRRVFAEPVSVGSIGFTTSQQTRDMTVAYSVRTPAAPGVGDAEGAGGSGGDEGEERPATEHTVRVTGVKPVRRPEAGSLEHWLKESRFTFGWERPRKGAGTREEGAGLRVYETIHSTWSTLEVLDGHLRFDFGAVFGEEWGFLSRAAPASTVLAIGSEIAIFPGRESVPVRWSVKR